MQIYKYAAPLQCFCVWTGGFTPEEIDQITFLEKLQTFEKGMTGAAKSPNQKVRDSDIAWINPDQNSGWLFERAAGIISKANHDHFMYDIHGFDNFQYTRYGPDQHYTWHWDLDFGWKDYERKISFVMMLSDPEDYEGGELEVCNNGNVEDTWVCKPNKGDVVLFASWMPHRVRPVISGERKSLVTWVMGKRQS